MKIYMKLIFLSVLLCYYYLNSLLMASEDDFLSTAYLKEITLKNDEFAEFANIEEELQNETFERSSDIDSLVRAKFKMINGDLRMAKSYLNRINDYKSRVVLIKKRYLALISFIEGDFSQSIGLIKDKHFYDYSIYPQICLLKIINFIALNDIESLQNEKILCMRYTLMTSKNEAFWLDTMIKLKMKDHEEYKKNALWGTGKTITDDEFSKLWLKTGLYLNKEKDLIEMLSTIPESSYQSKRLREIIAFMYLRLNTSKDRDKALAFIDDVDSANAENIKGNINLKNKEYELAFGHFQLALKKKQDSLNSLERAISLAWILNQWEDGLKILDNYTYKNLDPRNKRAIKIAFLIKGKKFIDASRELTLLKIDFQNQPPYEVNIMDNYVNLILAGKDDKYDKRKNEDTTEKSCQSFDGLSCWLSLQYTQWENLGKTIKRNENIFSDQEMTIESLKEKKEIKPLNETMTVDQRDIEELDSANIEISTDK